MHIKTRNKNWIFFMIVSVLKYFLGTCFPCVIELGFFMFIVYFVHFVTNLLWFIYNNKYLFFLILCFIILDEEGFVWSLLLKINLIYFMRSILKLKGFPTWLNVWSVNKIHNGVYLSLIRHICGNILMFAISDTKAYFWVLHLCYTVAIHPCLCVYVHIFSLTGQIWLDF